MSRRFIDTDTRTHGWLAQRVVDALGIVHPLALVTVYCGADGMWRYTIEPFVRETHTTSYHPGTLRIVTPSPSPLPPEFILE